MSIIPGHCKNDTSSVVIKNALHLSLVNQHSWSFYCVTNYRLKAGGGGDQWGYGDYGHHLRSRGLTIAYSPINK